jgi:formylglycine-generating enzyme
MRQVRAWNLIGIVAVLVMLQWSLYGCGGGGDSHSGEPSPSPFPATYTDPATGMEFVLVPDGCFKMGDNFGDGNSHELPLHEVCLDPFYMSKYPVTQGEWERVMVSNPSYHVACGANCPVELVSWNDVELFLDAFNAIGEKTYRLPTEAEWEYAARSGGRLEKYPGTSDQAKLGEYAWYWANAEEKTHPVGGKKPNGLGLYDMGGNVLEWVSDWYGPYSAEAQVNPTGPDSGDERVIRGSSYRCVSSFVRASMRDFSEFRRLGPDFKLRNLGFRIAFPADQ